MHCIKSSLDTLWKLALVVVRLNTSPDTSTVTEPQKESTEMHSRFTIISLFALDRNNKTGKMLFVHYKRYTEYIEGTGATLITCLVS